MQILSLINRSLDTGLPYTETTGSVQEPWQDLQWLVQRKLYKVQNNLCNKAKQKKKSI